MFIYRAAVHCSHMWDIECTQKRTDANYSNMILTTNTTKEEKNVLCKKKKSLTTGQKYMNFHMHEKARERFKNILIIAN